MTHTRHTAVFVIAYWFIC